MESFKQLDSGLIVPKTYKEYPLAMDLFCGCGGFSLGFIQAGFQVVAGFEISPEAAHTYMANLGSYPINIHYTSDKYREILTDYFEKYQKKRERRFEKEGKSTEISLSAGGLIESEDLLLFGGVSGSAWIKSQRMSGNYYPPVTNFFFGDIREVDGDWILDKLGLEKGDLDVVMGGPPCQGYSKAGKQKVMDPRNSLVFDFAKTVIDLGAKTFIMEEVPDIVNFQTSEGLNVVDQLCRIFEKGGYGDYESLKKGMFNSGKKAKAATKRRSKAKKETEKEEQEQLTMFDA